MMRFTRHSRAGKDEKGFVLVWFALVMVVLLGVAAFTVDILHAYSAAQEAQNTADAASLGGVVMMPDFPSADTLARDVAADNIDPSSAVVTPAATAQPNQLKVTVKKTINTFFARVLGFPTMDITRSAVAEYDAPTPLDLVLIIDRTSSMTPTDMVNVKDAANDLLEYLNPKVEHIALGVTPPSTTGFQCAAPNGGAYGRAVPSFGPGNVLVPPYSWMVSPYPAASFTSTLTSDYKNSDGTLNTSSQIVKTIACLERATISGVHTNLGSPVGAAVQYLQANARPGARQGIILMTDGEANQTNGQAPQPCQWAVDNAQTAKNANIQLLTIGFGVEGARCTRDTAGSYVSALATKFLADMASPINGTPADDNGCTTAENQDGDNFFCQPGTGDLSYVFVQAAAQLVNRSSRLVK
jgi:Flp pilus assembly protein TadG